MQRNLPKPLLDKKNASDKYLWTAQTITVKGCVYFVMRQSNGIQLYRYNYVTDQYDELDSLVEKKANLKDDRLFSDNDGWDHASHYMTIQLIDFNDELYVMSRSVRGIWLSRYDTQINKWESPWITELFTNADGWNSSSICYRVMQARVFNQQFYVVARGMHGLTTRLLDPVNNKIQKLDGDETIFGEGWQYEKYYLTIKTVVVNDQLYIIGKKSGGTYYRKWNVATQRWGDERHLAIFKNEDGWKESCFHTTISYLEAKNALYVCGRNAAGLVLYKVDLEKNTAELLSPAVSGVFNDKSGWSLENHSYQFKAMIFNDVVYVMFAAKNTVIARYDEKKKMWEAVHVGLPESKGAPMTDHCLKYMWNSDYQVNTGLLELLEFSQIQGEITPAFQSSASGGITAAKAIGDKAALLEWLTKKGMEKSRIFQVLTLRGCLEKADFITAIQQANKLLSVNAQDGFAIESKKYAMVERARVLTKSESAAEVVTLRSRSKLGDAVRLLRAVLELDDTYQPAYQLLRTILQAKVLDARSEIFKAFGLADLSLVVNLRDWLAYQPANYALPFDDHRNTLMHLAVQYKRPHMIAWLLLKGARLAVKNSMGYTASDLLKRSGDLEMKAFVETDPAAVVSHIDLLSSRIKEAPRKAENYLLRAVLYMSMTANRISVLEQEVYLQQARFDFERLFRIMPTLIEASEMASTLDKRLQVIKKEKQLAEQKGQVPYLTVLTEAGDHRVLEQLAKIQAQWAEKAPTDILKLYVVLFEGHQDLADVFKARAAFYLYQADKVASLTQKKVICQHANNDLKQAMLLNPFDNEVVSMMQKIVKMLTINDAPKASVASTDATAKPGLFAKK